MVALTIDGQTIEVPAGTTVLQAVRQAGIQIPTLCDHPSLQPYGGCRLCVVEVEGARTLQASCTLPAANGMVVHTDTPKVRKSRQFVLDLIFSERNHFCMYCQKSGGDCELQNAAYGEGMTHWPLQPNWKPYLVDASSPHFIFDHNRCILCRRCVRACSELVGNNTLGLENRGASTVVVADYGLPMGDSSCVSCGTCLQVCPTGALIDRQSAYLGLDSSMKRVPSVCAGCSVGCGIEMLVRDNQLVRIEGDWEAPVNQGVLCETGRFDALEAPYPRLLTPLVRREGCLEPASWEEALSVLASRLAPLAGRNGEGIAALASTRLTAEALYAFQDLFRSQLHASVVTTVEESRTHADVTDPALQGNLETLQAADCVVMIGADLAKSHQVAGFFVKRNLRSSTRLVVIDPFENEMSSAADLVLKPEPGTDWDILQGIMAVLTELGLSRTNPPAGFDSASISLPAISHATGVPVEQIAEAARLIGSAKSPVIVYGKGITHNGVARVLQALEATARMSGAVLLNPRGKANSLAAQRYSLTQNFETLGQQAVYLALGDDYPTARLMSQLEGVPFLAVQASYASPLAERADVVLPVEMWAEQSGSFLNLDGRLQQAHNGLRAGASTRSNLAVFQALAERLGVVLDANWEVALC